ncbi:MAG TPA: hypothetical protein PLJ00_12290 [Chitinophagales bacterium]|nr:hypothetical protein [Chitinophagales bacterium]HRG28666.1 hypothetical protein [Chitinophagales bacterium]HRG86457.1 hypothetical protein [Chitinophagales bacterium]HRH53083.1 hypothetical protein [Chitinophagales bacterium]
MKNIRTTQPEIKQVALQQRLKNMLDLTIAKVAAHVKAPQQYAMPADSSALEHKILRFYNVLKPHEKETFLAKTNLLFNQSATENRKRFEDLMDIDIKSSTPMLDKIKAFPLPVKYHFTEKEATAIIEKSAKLKTIQKTKSGLTIAPQQAAEPRTLSLFLESVKCNDPQDVLKDEIFFSGFTLDALGVNEPIPFTSAGKYKKNDFKQLQIKLRDFDLRAAGVFPQDFLLALFVFEKDSKKDDERLKFTMELIQDIGLWVLAAADVIAIAALVVTIASTSPVGMALIIASGVIAAIGLSIIGVISLINNLRLAEISLQVTDLFTFPDPPINVGEQVINKHQVVLAGSLSGVMKGNYDLQFRWERTA